MAGIFDYKRYINIFATAEDVKETFPRDQYSLTWDMDGVGADGWTCDIDWMTLVIDKVNYANGEPNFNGSSVIGFFPGSTTSTVQTSTTIILPANMYEGPILPGGDINVPATAVNLNWSKGSLNFQRQLLLIQNWEPGTEIGNPENDANYTPIADSYPITVNWYLNTTTVFTNTTITVVATATSTESFTISNTVSTVLVTPQFGNIPSPLLTATNFIDGEFTATFYVGNNWVELAPTPTSIYTILTSTITTSTYNITANITRNHPIRLRWQYDKSTGYRGGQTTAKTLTVSTTRNVTYFGQPISVSLAQQIVNVRIGDTSTFTVSHTANETEAITGVVTLSGTVFYSTATSPQPITIGTGTFNANKQIIFNAILNTGTYTLTALYSGNIGNNIFRTMYLATASNTITHFVAFGREFALTEMLIARNTSSDVLYAHAIDDGRSAGEIGGAVTFYENGNVLGTSTFVRHTYQFPVTQSNVPYNSPITSQSFTHIGFNDGYPRFSFTNNQYDSFYYGKGAKNFAFQYDLTTTYSLPNSNANLKYNSGIFDWPPTYTKINTIGIVAASGDYMPITPFEIPLTSTYKPDGQNQVGAVSIICETLLQVRDIPSYPAQTINIRPQWDYSNKTEIDTRPYGFGEQVQSSMYRPYIVQTAPGGCWPSYDPARYREWGYFIGGYYSWRTVPRTNGQKYFVQNESANPGSTVCSDLIDMGDVWPLTQQSNTRKAYPKTYIFKFKVKYVDSVSGQTITTELPPPNVIYDNTNPSSEEPYNYGYKSWLNGLSSGLAYQAVWDWMTGNQSAGPTNFSLFAPGQGVTVGAGTRTFASRSHLATLSLPLNTVSTTSVFTATFAGTLDQGIEGYFSEGIPFTYSTTSTLNMAGGTEYIETFEQGGYPWQLTSKPLQAATLSTKVETDPGGLRWVGYYWNKPPTYSPQITNWLNIGVYPGSVTQISSWLGTNLFNKHDASDGQEPNVIVYSLTTGQIYSNVLAPETRDYPFELATDYVKRVGWLNERTPKGNVRFVLNNNTITSYSNSLTNIENSNYIEIYAGTSLFQVDPQINLPAPVRYNSYPYRSSNQTSHIARLDLLGLDSYTTATTATVVYPVRMDYIPSSTFLQTSTQYQYVLNPPNSPTTRDMKVSFLWNRGTSVKFKSNNPAYLQTPPVQRYLVHSAVYDLPYANNYGDSPRGVKWSSVNPQGYVASIILGNDLGTTTPTLTNYRIRVPSRDNNQVLFWYHRWSVERWSADGSTLLGTYSPPEFARRFEFTEIYDNSLNPSMLEVKLYPLGTFDYRSGYVIYNSYGETGVVVNSPPSPTFGPYLYKVYVELHNGGLTGLTRNSATGNEYYTTRTTTTNGLVRKNAEWGFETNYGNASPDVPGKTTTPLFQLQTLTPTGYQDIYTNNGVL